MDSYYFLHQEYTARTRHLSAAEDLALRRTIDLIIMEDWDVKPDPIEIARRIDMSDHLEAVKVILEEFFFVDPNGRLDSTFTDRVVSLNEPR